MSVGRLYEEYWDQFARRLPRHEHPFDKAHGGGRERNWMDWKILTSPSLVLAAGVTRQKGAIYASVWAPHSATARFRAICQRHEHTITSKLVGRVGGDDLIWGLPPGGKVPEQVNYLRYGEDITDRSAWPRQHTWIIDRLRTLYAAFAAVA